MKEEYFNDWNYQITCERCGVPQLAAKTPFTAGICHFCWNVEEQFKFWPHWFTKQFWSAISGVEYNRLSEEETAQVVIDAIRQNPDLNIEAIEHGINKAYCQGELQKTHRYWASKILTALKNAR